MKSRTTITLYKDLSEGECAALKAILNVPHVVEKAKNREIQSIKSLGVECDEITVDFRIEES